MAENQILPFAQGQGANVLSQADYAGDSMRLQGHQPGVARSALENKALRQATSMAAGLAQFVADNQDADITDELTPAEVAEYLSAAALASLPDATRGNRGLAQNATVSEAAALTDQYHTLTPSTLVSAFSGNASISANGYQKLPDGIILQWGLVSKAAAATGNITITFPIAFPNNRWIELATNFNNTDEINCALTSSGVTNDRAQIKLLWRSVTGSIPSSISTFYFSWFAIGR